ncbi:unnamed protein product, partial [Brenthis ino]
MYAMNRYPKMPKVAWEISKSEDSPLDVNNAINMNNVNKNNYIFTNEVVFGRNKPERTEYMIRQLAVYYRHICEIIRTWTSSDGLLMALILISRMFHLVQLLHRLIMGLTQNSGIFLITEVGDLFIIWGNLPLMTGTAFVFFTNLAQTTKFINIVTRREMIIKIISNSDKDLRSEKSIRGRNIIERYPYNINKSPAYELTYMHQVFSTFSVALLNVSKDTLVTTLIAQCRCRLRLVGLPLRTLNNNRRFTEVIQYHVTTSTSRSGVTRYK